MKNLLKNVSFAIMLLKMCFIFGQETDAQKRIVIDVGHGGKDSGAIGINGIQEKDIVLKIAKEIVSLNQKSNTPMDIYLTRYNDTLISLSDRTKLSKALNADLFISLHCNHSDNPKARGIEVYVGKNEYVNSKESVWLAYQLQNQIKKQLGFEIRGVKFANFQVLREAAGIYPAMLVELGFLSNWDEGKFINKEDGIVNLAFSILNVINFKK
ncbi:MAG: N-acetylmuramoyl-L-alanine amidase [Pseudooceanicola sp.]|nr:N-acetylmuramoyl-L-alanine amidase [Pseudooceanicola sp.]|tara:strand:- start:10602 stop:11237 length:636 start_codon:yes stop_codon:yes gene_type:complete